MSLCTVHVVSQHSEKTIWQCIFLGLWVFKNCFQNYTKRDEVDKAEKFVLCEVLFAFSLWFSSYSLLLQHNRAYKNKSIEEEKSQTFFSGIYKIIKVLNAFKNYRMKLTAYKNMKWFFLRSCRQATAAFLYFSLLSETLRKSHFMRL